MERPGNDVTPDNCSMDAGGFRTRNLGVIINKQGYMIHPDIKQRNFPGIEYGNMPRKFGIVVHQTDGPTIQSAFNQYQKGGNGAHFLIDKDGIIYQTASVFKVAHHVGRLKPRCLAEHRCTPAEEKRLNKLMQKPDAKMLNQGEMKKSVPDRYPSNKDSIGIELVGDAGPKSAPEALQVYEPVTAKQKRSLQWLVQIITDNFDIKMAEIYRHPILSWKNATEASTATW